ncbi:MAG: DUF167 domain-containing protein [Patescibacteria group bacterium]|nr:DUF167 domain-containing protein [Patescibacteria group bacterium]
MELKKYFSKLKEEGQIYLSIKVFPASSETKIKEIRSSKINNQKVEIILISIKAPADKNKANQELIKFLAQEFDTDKESVIIISGKTDRIKLVKINK